MANAAVAGVLAQLVMHSTQALALTSAGMLMVGIVAWLWVNPKLLRGIEADQVVLRRGR